MPDELIPLFAIFFIFGAPVTAWVISRVLAHQERIEMIRNGYIPPPDPRAMRNASRYGTWQGGPIPPPAAGPIPPNVKQFDDSGYCQGQLRKGITVSLVGLALLIGLSFIGASDGGFHYGPWLLGGLIPLFVGIAQIINAVLNGAQIPRFGPPTGGGTYVGPRPMNQGSQQPPPQQPQAPPPPPGGAYGWRPGPTPEIEKPAQPPDSR